MPGTPISGLPPYTTQSGGTEGVVESNQLFPISNNDTITYPNQAYKLNLDELTEFSKTQHFIQSSYLGNDLPPSSTLRLSLVGSPPTNEITITGGTSAQNQYALDRIAISSIIGPVSPLTPPSLRIVGKTGTPGLLLENSLGNTAWENQAYSWKPPLISTRNITNSIPNSFSVDATGVLQNYNPYFMGVLTPTANDIPYDAAADPTIFPSTANHWTQLDFTKSYSNKISVGSESGGNYLEFSERGIYQIFFQCNTVPVSSVAPGTFFHVACVLYDNTGSGFTIQGGNWIGYVETVTTNQTFTPQLNFITFIPHSGARLRFWAINQVNFSIVPMIGGIALSTAPMAQIGVSRIMSFYNEP